MNVYLIQRLLPHMLTRLVLGRPLGLQGCLLRLLAGDHALHVLELTLLAKRWCVCVYICECACERARVCVCPRLRV